MKKNNWYISVLVFLVFAACSREERACTDELVKDVPMSQPFFDKDTTVEISNGKNPITVTLKLNKGAFKGTIVALPGWNYAALDWCNKTSLCESAINDGYCVVLVEMGKSIYATKNYEQTRKDWQKEPTLTWFSEKLIPEIQREFQLLLSDQSNWLVGLSTGARGAFLIANKNDDVFKGAACLSGDFNQTAYPQDNLYRGFFGEYASNKEIWETTEHPLNSMRKKGLRFYFGHGALDQVVPSSHSNYVFDALNDSMQTKNVLHIDSNAKHDYDFWNSEVKNVLNFFNK